MQVTLNPLHPYIKNGRLTNPENTTRYALVCQAVMRYGKAGVLRSTLREALAQPTSALAKSYKGKKTKGKKTLMEYAKKIEGGANRRGYTAYDGKVQDWQSKPQYAVKDQIDDNEKPLPGEIVEESPEHHSIPHPLNQILYGPPGTGKTYQTVNYAVAIVENQELDEIKEEDRKEVKRRFDDYKKEGRIAMVTFHQSFAYEDFIEGIKPKLGSSNIEYTIEPGIFKQIVEKAIIQRNEFTWTDEDSDRNCVLIIDEINRGNIAKIFGELITLIEDSKRLEEDDALTTKLPYSKKEFGVPNNLYILGTMNTADRSIMQLDTALRRRFEFVELMPKPKIISENIEGVNCRRLLEKMNKRIRVLLDREHQIGHTYLMNDVTTLEDLKKTFQNNIMPLLQEYFYDDWQKIDFVLNGNGFIKPSKDHDHELKKAIDSELVGEEQKIYELLPFDDGKWESEESYQAIYKDKDTRTTAQLEGQPNTDNDPGE